MFFGAILMKNKYAIATGLNKKFLKEINLGSKFNNESMKVYMVDGEFVRDNYFTDYTLGGHDLVYGDFIPSKEIWLEDCEHPESYRFTLLHEVLERTLMQFWNLDYETAHDYTTKVEKKLRKLQYKYTNLFEKLNLNEFEIHPTN